MAQPSGQDDGPGTATEPSVSASVDVATGSDPATVEAGGGLAPSEAFQTLASEVRVTVLVELLAAERTDETPLSFSALQSVADVDSSAGFAYHLRQLSGQFVRQREDGYTLTPAGRRAAELVLDGAFSGGAGSAS